MIDQVGKANTFAKLHQAGHPLVLYNIWDAGSAAITANTGAFAVATSSYAVAAAYGFEDGEQLPLEFLYTIAERICASCSLPVSIDFEGAYSSVPEMAASNAKGLIDVGAVGINIEDQIVGGEGLHSIADQCARISALRAMANQAGVPLFINARTDCFLQAADPSTHARHLTEAINRHCAYAEAGASGFFAPGLTEPSLIEKLCRQAQLPINVMANANTPSIQSLAHLA